MDDITYVLCIPVIGTLTDGIVAGSAKVKCCKCAKELWRAPWNADKTPICLDCIRKEDKPRMILDKKNVEEAVKFILRTAGDGSV